MSVMNVKRSTQAFSPAQQTSSLKSDLPNTQSATDLQKTFGDRDLGQILNQVADPNWVDPTKKMRTAGDNQLDKDAFLKLMLAQMKHQDPTNPMQSHEMAAQLAQFTSLEQLNNINSTLEEMKNSQSPNGNFQALAFIGKKVSGDSSKLTRAAGDTRHSFNFELLNDASNVELTIKDAGGNLVRKLEYNNLKKGQNSVEWNGLMEDGLAARPGEYKLSVNAKNSNGARVHAKTSFEGRITGLNYTSQGPVLLVGDQTIKLSDVRKIEEPGMSEVKEATTPMTTLKPVDQSKAAEEYIPPAEEPDMPPGNIGDIPMAREILEQLSQSEG